MRAIYSLVLVILFLNFGTGIIYIMFPGDADNIKLSDYAVQEYTYNEQELAKYDTGSANVSPTAQADASTGLFRLWDFFNLGQIANFIEVIKTGLFGFPALLINVFSSVMSDNMHNYLTKAMYILFTTLYSFAAFSLYTGRNPFQD